MPKLTSNQVKIKFQLQENQFSVLIETPRLTIRSVTLADIEHYISLFADEDVMRKYASGQPNMDRSKIQDRIGGWVQRWAKNDPFNGLVVFDKQSGEFIGHVVLGRSDEGNGVSELAYLFHKKFWHQGIGTEAVSSVVNHYAIEISKRNYLLDGHKFNRITATTRVDHPFSRKVLETVGLSTDSQINHKFGADRYIYNAPVCKQNSLSKQAMYYGVAALVSGLGLYVAYRALNKDVSQPVASQDSQLTL